MIRRFPDQVNQWALSGPPLLLSRYLRLKGRSGNSPFKADFATARLVSCAVFREGVRSYLYGDAYLTIGEGRQTNSLVTLVLDLGLVDSCEACDRTEFEWSYTGHTIVHGGGRSDVRDVLVEVRKLVDEFAQLDLDPSITAACASGVTVGIVDLRSPNMPIVGSGVVLSPDGMIGTNRHVVEGVTGIEPTGSDPWPIGVLFWQQVKRETKAFVVRTRSEWIVKDITTKAGRKRPEDATDLAILDVGIQGLPSATFLESCSALVPGQKVIACGYPSGSSFLVDGAGVRQRMPFVLSGSISALREDANGHLEQLVCDLPVIPGSSGSPVFLQNRAELVGLVSHALQHEGSFGPLSLVLPIATVKMALLDTRSRAKDSKPRVAWEQVKAAAKRGDSMVVPLVGTEVP